MLFNIKLLIYRFFFTYNFISKFIHLIRAREINVHHFQNGQLSFIKKF